MDGASILHDFYVSQKIISLPWNIHTNNFNYFLIRFIVVDNIYSLFSGINTFLISFFLSLISFVLTKEYLETKHLMNLKLKTKDKKTQKSSFRFLNHSLNYLF